MDRAPDYESGGQEFESLRSPAPAGRARLIRARRRVVVSDDFSLRNDRNPAARFEDRKFDLVHPFEPVTVPRRFEYVLLGDAGAPQSSAQNLAVLDHHGRNALQDLGDTRYVSLDEGDRNVGDDEGRDHQEGMGERIVL